MRWVVLDPGLVSVVDAVGPTVGPVDQKNDTLGRLSSAGDTPNGNLQAIDFAWSERSISVLSMRYGKTAETELSD